MLTEHALTNVCDDTDTCKHQRVPMNPQQAYLHIIDACCSHTHTLIFPPSFYVSSHSIFDYFAYLSVDIWVYLSNTLFSFVAAADLL